MDLTINNPRISKFLSGSTETIPMKELRTVFEDPTLKDNFLLSLKDRLNAAIKKATRDRISDFPSDQITKHLIILANTVEVFRENSSEQEKEEALKAVANSLKRLWIISITT